MQGTCSGRCLFSEHDDRYFFLEQHFLLTSKLACRIYIFINFLNMRIGGSQGVLIMTYQNKKHECYYIHTLCISKYINITTERKGRKSRRKPTKPDCRKVKGKKTR